MVAHTMSINLKCYVVSWAKDYANLMRKKAFRAGPKFRGNGLLMVGHSGDRFMTHLVNVAQKMDCAIQGLFGN